MFDNINVIVRSIWEYKISKLESEDEDNRKRWRREDNEVYVGNIGYEILLWYIIIFYNGICEEFVYFDIEFNKVILISIDLGVVIFVVNMILRVNEIIEGYVDWLSERDKKILRMIL